MTTILFTNDATTSLASAVVSTDTAITVAAGTGGLFPSPTGGQYFTLSFVDAATGLVTEITNCTGRTGDVLTVARAQEGTAALSWQVGDIAANYLTAASLAALGTQLQLGFTPVQQGGGVGQTNDKVYLGSNGGSLLRAQINGTDLGFVAQQNWVATYFLPDTGGTISGALHVVGGTQVDGGLGANSLHVTGGAQVDGNAAVTGALSVTNNSSLGGGLSVTGTGAATVDLTAGRDVTASRNVTGYSNVYSTGYIVVAGSITYNKPAENAQLGASMGQGTVDACQTNSAYTAANFGTTFPGLMVQFFYNGSPVGSIYTSGTATAYNTTSDYRLKQDVADLGGSLDLIAHGTKARTFAFKSAPDVRCVGFIAHELAETVPSAVTGDLDGAKEHTNAVLSASGRLLREGVSEGDFAALMASDEPPFPPEATWHAEATVPVYQQVDHSALVPHLYAAIQEAAAVIADLRARVAAIEGRSA